MTSPSAGAVRICLGQAQLTQGQASDALRHLERAASSPACAGHERTAAQAWASYARLALGDLDGALTVAHAARSAAAAAGDHLSLSIAMASLALVCEFRGQLADALQLIDEAVSLADQSPGRIGHRYPLHAIRGWLLIELDRRQDARSSLSTGRQLSEDLGVRWPLPTYQVFLAFERFMAGDWDEALTELQAGFELAEEIGEIYSRVYADGVLALISFHRNDLSRADAAASAAARDLACRSPGYRMTLAGWPRALILEAGGDLSRALATLAGAWDTCTRLGLVLEYPAVGADLVRLALAAGDLGRARAVSAAVTEVAAGNEVPWITGAALHCQGLVADDAELLQAAAAACARGSRPLQLALACEDAGAASARHGDLERARPLLDQALAIYERLHAARDLARIEAVAARGGHQARPPGDARSPAGRVAQSHPGRARGRRAGRRGAVQSPDRRAPVRVTPDRADAYRARLRQARPDLPGASGCRGNQACGQPAGGRREPGRRLSPARAPGLAPTAAAVTGQKWSNAVRHFLRAQIDHCLSVEALEIGDIAAIHGLRIRPAEHLEHHLVPVLVRLRAAADHAEVERGQVPGPEGGQDLGKPLPQRPAVLLGQLGHIGCPAHHPPDLVEPARRERSQPGHPAGVSHPPGTVGLLVDEGAPVGPMPLFPCSGLLDQTALAGQAVSVVSGLEVRMNQRRA